MTANATSNDVLSKLASTTELEKFIHERKEKGTDIFNKLAQEDPMFSAIRAVKAVIGAVFVDGGSCNLDTVKNVMDHLGLKIKRGK
jgi:dsRNA-specific ribonuclease